MGACTSREDKNVDIEKNINKDIQHFTNNDSTKETYKTNNKHLICDDAYTNRLVLKKYLVMFGYEVDEAENGEDAINKIKENGKYNIIWMDIKMPKMDGFECTRQLRTTMNYNGVIIGLTGYVDDITMKKCLELGMNRVIKKPFDKEIILLNIENYNTNN